MKEQQRTAQETRDRWDKSKQEQRSTVQKHVANLPAQQWVQLLRQGDGLLDLPATLLEQLAEAVGNSSLTELLRGSGGEAPALCSPERLDWNAPEMAVNYIETAPPMLVSAPEWSAQQSARLQPARPDKIRIEKHA